jgi:cell division protein FtsI (penicillin-binding protein 3)
MVLVCVLMSLLAGRLVQLQGLDASTYESMATSTQLRQVDLPAQRGAILDRNGEVMAQSVDAYDIIVDQKMITEEGNAAAHALELAELLDRDITSVQRALTGEKRYSYLAKRVSPMTWVAISELRLNGIYGEPSAERIYPAGSVAGNVIGFVGAEGHGLGGLEHSLNSQLAGVDGTMTYQETGANVRIPLGAGSRENAVPGQSIMLTIDRDIQWYAEQAIAKAVENARAAGGNVVVQDVRTGEILAMATAPVVDPAEPGATDPEDRGNRVVEEVYEPGSVFKPVTMAAIVEEGMAGPGTVFSVPDRVTRSGETIRDYYNHPEERMTLAGVMAKSSNVGTILAAERLNAGTFGEYLREFGFGASTSLGLPAEAGGRLPAEWSELDRDFAAFGQGISVNTVQLASAYSTIANGGVRMPPTLIAADVDVDGATSPRPAGAPTQVVSAEAATAVTKMLEAVMGPDGTGRNSTIDGYRVAGKTGTAQRINPDCGCYRDYNASFVGFAPADEPRYSIAVSLLDPKRGNSGGALAGPVFKDVMEFTLQRMGVAPTGAEPPDVKLYAE